MAIPPSAVLPMSEQKDFEGRGSSWLAVFLSDAAQSVAHCDPFLYCVDGASAEHWNRSIENSPPSSLGSCRGDLSGVIDLSRIPLVSRSIGYSF